MNDLYESMQKHPDTGPVMALMALVEPVDEFSRALCLVRDCFSPNQSRRTLSRTKLRALLGERLKLVIAYETAVFQAARDAGAKPQTYAEAIKALSAEEFTDLHMAYVAQVDKLMSR